jgi:predicted esterase
MRPLTYAFASFCIAAAAAAAEGPTITDTGAASVADAVGTLRLVAPDDTGWHAGAPLWRTSAKDVTAQGWMAITRKALLCRVVVSDPEQNNEFHGRNLWRGDSVYLSISAGPRSAEDAAADRFGDADAVYCFGLGGKGAEARTVRHGQPARRGTAPNHLIKVITRDEKANTTTYDLRVPWADLNTAHGQVAAIGVAINVAHKNSDKSDQAWGTIVKRTDRITGKVTPRRLHRLRLDAGDEDFVTIAPRRTRLFAATDSAEASVAVKSAGEVVVKAVLGRTARELRVPGGKAVRRITVAAPMANVRPGADVLKVTVTDAKLKVIEQAAFPLTNPLVVMERFRKHVAALSAIAPNDLVKRHLDSTLRVVARAYDALTLEGEEHPDRVEFFVNTVQVIQAKLPKEKVDWNDHVGKALPLVFAFVSDRDHTLQFSFMQLPCDWDPEKTYPLTVYLHGAGDNNPLAGLQAAFDNTHQDTLFRYEDIDRANIPPSHRGFVLVPWARGNSHFKHAGEDDVWQSLAMMKKWFKIDRDRMYIAGFSMGCSGAWGLATRTPDLWAGVNLASGFGSWSQTVLERLADNAKGLPIKIWIGELDGMVVGAKAFAELCEKKGLNAKLEIAPRLPHTYPYDEFQKNIGYLMQFRRTTPKTFSFVTDTFQHPGRNGVTMRVPYLTPANALPSFQCVVDGAAVRIDSSNTTGLSVVLGEGGLGLKGDATIFWNGEKAYAGPPVTVKLGDGARGY